MSRIEKCHSTHSTTSSTSMTWRPNNKYRRICFTANIPEEKTWEDFDLETLRVRLNPEYMICGKETASTGQKHYQGYLEFSKQKKGSTVMNQFSTWGIKAHLEAAMGTSSQNKDYCSKEDTEPFLFGKPTGNDGQGSRTDLGMMFQAVAEGVNGADLVAIDPAKWAVHRKALEEYRSILAPKRAWPSKLVFLWGPTGHGKTAHAMELEPEVVHYREPFLQGYTGHSENVLFDDFNWKKMDPKYWLTLCDRYPMSVEVKGALRNWAPKIICFTSNDDPKTWWPEAPEETRKAIHRRMEEFGTIRMLGDPVPVGQKMLTEFLSAASSGAGGSTAVAAPLTVDQAAASLVSLSEPLSGVDHEVVDLTQDSEDDEPICGKRLREDWDDAHSDYSNECAEHRKVNRMLMDQVEEGRACAQRCGKCGMKWHQCWCD